jgi:16S rRNA (uracil1498-N3)-methyltransferase
VLRVPVPHLEPGDLTLDEDTSRYVARVHRLREGASVLLFDATSATEATATLLEMGRSGVRCNVGPLRPSAVRARRAITLLQGVGKGDKLDAIVRDATELGVTRVVAVESKRSVVRLGTRSEDRLARWNRIATEAARQCGRGDAPLITGPLSWEAALGEASQGDPLRLCLWERATAPIGPRLRELSGDRPLVVAVGPEGGIDESEVDFARGAGFHIVSLGPFILRTETVAAAVLGAVLLLGE